MRTMPQPCAVKDRVFGAAVAECFGKRKTPSELRIEQLKRIRSQDAGPSQRSNFEAPKAPRFLNTRVPDVYQATKPSDKPKFSLSKAKDVQPFEGEDVNFEANLSTTSTHIQAEASTALKCDEANRGVPKSKFKNVAELSSRIQKQNSSTAVDMAEAIKGLGVNKVHVRLPGRSVSAPSKLLEAGFDSQTTLEYPGLPLDLSLKLSARIISSKPFHWCHRLGVQNRFQGLKQFIEVGLGIDTENFKCTESGMENQAHFWKGLHSWIYPQLSFPSAVLSALISSADRGGENEHPFLSQRQRDWEDSFRSLYYAFRNKLCNIFYFCAQQFVVLFIGGGIGGRSNDACSAYLTRSTRGLRGLLQKQGVNFSMPLCKLESTSATMEELQDLSEFERLNPGQTRLVDSMTAVDNSIQSLLAFDGNENVHHLYDFLLNYGYFVGTMTSAELPTLCSPVPFHNASLKVPEVCSKQMQVLDDDAGGSMHNSYSLEIKGALLAPWVISRVCVAILKLHEENFEVSFTTETLSEGLNVAQANEDAPNNNTSGFGQASGLGSSVIKQLKCINGSYVASL